MSLKRREGSIDWTSIASSIHKGISQLKHEDSYTDFVVEIGEKSFHCHKVVLASVSDYFKALFSSGMKENEHNKVVFDDVSPASFQIILDILYPVEQKDPLENIQETDISDLLKLAGRFQMTLLLGICLKFYKGTMSVRNCVARWKLGEEIMCDELSEMGYGFIKENFEEMAYDGLLVSLEYDDFHKIVEDETMHVKREDMVWSAIQTWIKFDTESRSPFIADLLRECCLTEINPDFLVEEIAFDSFVRQNDTASKLVQETVKYKRHPGMHGNLELKFRECHEKRQTTFLIFKDDSDVENADVSNDALKGIAVCSEKAFLINMDRLLSDTVGDFSGNLSCCVHGESVYILKDQSNRRSRFWEYKSAEDSWDSLREIDTPLAGHSMCAADGCLYVIGGRSSYQINAQVWQYSIEGNSWTIEGEIMAPVVNASSVCVNNKIYIFGGELENGAPADCVQVYDTEAKDGTIFCNLPKPCSFSRALVRGQTAYVVTSDGDVVSVSLETSESTVLATIPNFERVNFGIRLQRNQLHVFKGHEKRNDEVSDDRSTTKAKKIADFLVDINNGEIKSSKWLYNAGYRKKSDVLACVAVVLDIRQLKPFKKKLQK